MSYYRINKFTRTIVTRVDEETHKQLRLIAAEQNISVVRLVRKMIMEKLEE